MYAAIGLLLAAIATEVAAHAQRCPRTQGFKDPLWSAMVIGGLSRPRSGCSPSWCGTCRCPRRTPSGPASARPPCAVIGVLWLGESLNPLKVAALAMIITGVVVLNLQGAH